MLVPAALRDVLLRAAVSGLYDVVWSADILHELETVLVREGMTTHEKARYLTDTLRREFPDAAAPAGYRQLIPTMGNHMDDRHVLAAAVRSAADVIVTANTRHFPVRALNPYGLVARTPDEFLAELFSLDPDEMCTNLLRQAEALRHSNYSIEDILNGLERHVPQFAASARDHIYRREQ